MTTSGASDQKANRAASALLDFKHSLSEAINEEMLRGGLNQSRVSEKCGISRPKVSQLVSGKFSNEFKAELLAEILLTLNPSRKFRLAPPPKLLWEKTGDKLLDLKFKLASAISQTIDREGYSLREAASVAGWSDHKRTTKIKNGDLSESKLDSLIQMLMRLDSSYTLEVLPVRDSLDS